MSFSRQEGYVTKGRQNQKQRTRQALIDAAVALMREGHVASIAEVAEAARVSLATAYRYFPNPQSLRADAAIRAFHTGPDLEALMARAPDDPAVRLETLVRAIARMQLADETLWRGVLQATLERWFAQTSAGDEPVPVRGTSRMDLLSEALAPLGTELPPAQHRRLKMALMLVFGLEAMVTTRDACGLDPDEATDVMAWAATTLLAAARAEQTGTRDS